MIWLQWLLLAAALFAVASVFALWSYGRFARKARGPESHLIPPGSDAPLDRAIGALEAAHPGQTGAALEIDNRGAFLDRLHTIRAAHRSLDMLYYIWRDDLTGRLLVHELLAAADRGVRVRVLLDDVNTLGFDPSYLGLNGHPGIEVRLFNPVTARRSALRRGLALLLALVRYNRRMHCKAWIADGRLAIIGGRNIGDVYFDATQRRRRRNCRDADLLLAGSVVQKAAEVFDTYWNSGMAIPIGVFWSDHKSDLADYRRKLEALAKSRRARTYLSSLGDPAVEGDAAAQRLAVRRFHWSSGARLVADPPDKAQGHGRDSWMPAALQPVLNAAEHQVALTTPYLVPGREGMAVLTSLAKRGVKVSVLTNALSATNHILVHGAYRRYRRGLLASGMAVYEFAPPPTDRARRPKGEMLHAKAFVVDGRLGFVGSFNFDLRSLFLNTEMGVIVDHPALIAALEREFARATSAEEAWELALDGGGKLSWRRDAASARRDPNANAWRRGVSWVIGHLPIHRWL